MLQRAAIPASEDCLVVGVSMGSFQARRPDRMRGTIHVVPMLTVIMPTYERPQLLDVALKSALGQTFGDIEILIGDNSDSDDTESLVSTFDDPRIKYHRNRPGLGPQGNWLDLVQRAKGELVASLHDDDFWHPQFLAKIVPVMISDPEIAMTFCDFWIVDAEGNKLPGLTNLESKRTRRSSLPRGDVGVDYQNRLRMVAVWGAPQPAYAAVVRRQQILDCDFPEDTVPLYDIWLSYQLVRNRQKIRFEPNRLTYYRQHPGSLTSGGYSRAEDAVFRRILAENNDLPVEREVYRYWCQLKWARGAAAMETEGADEWGRQEMMSAVQGLGGWKYIVASGVGRSQLLWEIVKVGKRRRNLSRRDVV